jgi:hypothetical protein
MSSRLDARDVGRAPRRLGIATGVHIELSPRRSARRPDSQRSGPDDELQRCLGDGSLAVCRIDCQPARWSRPRSSAKWLRVPAGMTTFLPSGEIPPLFHSTAQDDESAAQVVALRDYQDAHSSAEQRHRRCRRIWGLTREVADAAVSGVHEAAERGLAFAAITVFGFVARKAQVQPEVEPVSVRGTFVRGSRAGARRSWRAGGARALRLVWRRRRCSRR